MFVGKCFLISTPEIVIRDQIFRGYNEKVCKLLVHDSSTPYGLFNSETWFIYKGLMIITATYILNVPLFVYNNNLFEHSNILPIISNL